MYTLITPQDEQEIFSHQHTPGTFHLFSVETACLNYLDGLNRIRLNPLCRASERSQAARRLVTLEKKLFAYIQEETQIDYFNTDFKEETERYITARTLFLKAANMTFKQHRFQLLLQLLRLYREDPCSILPERDIMIKKWEEALFQHYILLDMGWKNTEDIGREAISNGYHECDYTLEIEDVWKQPAKAVPPSHIRYVLGSLKDSAYAASTALYLRNHGEEVKASRWVVDVSTIEKNAASPLPVLTQEDIRAVMNLYHLV